jgi:hypothetical protein
VSETGNDNTADAWRASKGPVIDWWSLSIKTLLSRSIPERLPNITQSKCLKAIPDIQNTFPLYPQACLVWTLPSRGYWAKLVSGATGKKTPLPDQIIPLRKRGIRPKTEKKTDSKKVFRTIRDGVKIAITGSDRASIARAQAPKGDIEKEPYGL